MGKSLFLKPDAMERTYIMVKPDGVERKIVGEIIARFERKGYFLVAMKLMQPTKALLEQHYGDLKGKPFFPKLVDFMSSGPVVAMCWSGKDVVKQGRVMLGETNPLASLPGTIRGDFCVDIGRNICHGTTQSRAQKRKSPCGSRKTNWSIGHLPRTNGSTNRFINTDYMQPIYTTSLVFVTIYW